MKPVDKRDKEITTIRKSETEVTQKSMLTMRTTPEHVAALKRRAERKGYSSVSEMIRQLAIDELAREAELSQPAAPANNASEPEPLY